MQQSEIAAQQFGSVAADYLTSPVHAQGTDLQELAASIPADSRAHVLDLGCGAGHASYAVAARVGEVCAYDVSDDMLKVVASAARDRQLHNIRTRQGMAESLPFADA